MPRRQHSWPKSGERCLLENISFLLSLILYLYILSNLSLSLLLVSASLVGRLCLFRSGEGKDKPAYLDCDGNILTRHGDAYAGPPLSPSQVSGAHERI